MSEIPPIFLCSFPLVFYPSSFPFPTTSSLLLTLSPSTLLHFVSSFLVSFMSSSWKSLAILQVGLNLPNVAIKLCLLRPTAVHLCTASFQLTTSPLGKGRISSPISQTSTSMNKTGAVATASDDVGWTEVSKINTQLQLQDK